MTAFHPDQKDWGEERPFRPKILFQLDPPKDRKDPTYAVGNMMYNGHLLLDPDNRPIHNFHEIPLTVSSQVEGWVMEAIRRQHSKISANDFRARMPRDPSGKKLRDIHGKWTGPGKDSLSKSGSVDMRMTRWRMKHRCASWVERGGSKRLRDYFWEQLTPENQAANTTEWMSDVTDEMEMKLIESLNLGQYPNRSNRKKTGQQGKPQDAILGSEEPGRMDDQSTEQRDSQYEEDPEEDEDSATTFEDARQSQHEEDPGEGDGLAMNFEDARLLNFGDGSPAPLNHGAIQQAPMPMAAQSTNPMKRKLQASNIYGQSHGRLAETTDSPRYAKRARQEGRMEPSKTAQTPLYDGTLPMAAQSSNPLKRKTDASNIYGQLHSELVENTDSPRYAKKARQEGRTEPLKNARSDRRVEPGKGSKSRTDFMLQRRFQGTDTNTDTGNLHRGPSAEVPHPSPVGSYIDPNVRHIGVEQQPVHFEHTYPLTFGNNPHSAQMGFQNGNIPAFGGMMYPPLMGYQHGCPTALGGMGNQAHTGYGYNPAVGGIAHHPYMAYGHNPAFGGMAHQPYVAYGHNPAFGMIHQPYIGNGIGHNTALGIGQPFMASQHQTLPAIGGMVPMEYGNQHHPALGMGHPALGMGHSPYMSYLHGDLGGFGDGIGQAQMGPYQPLQQDETSTETVKQGNSDYIPDDAGADLGDTGSNHTSIETFKEGDSGYITNDGGATMDGTGIDGDEMEELLKKAMAEYATTDMGYVGQPIEQAGEGTDAHTNGVSGGEEEAGAELNESQARQELGGEGEDHSSARDENVEFVEIEDGLEGDLTTGSSQEAGIGTDTFACGESDHEERMEADREDQDADELDSLFDEAEDILHGTEEDTPALIEGVESPETPARPFTPEQGHTKQGFTSVEIEHGEETQQNQDENTEESVEKVPFLEDDTVDFSTNFMYDLEIPMMKSPEPSSSRQSMALNLTSDQNDIDSLFEEPRENNGIDSLFEEPGENVDVNSLFEEPGENTDNSSLLHEPLDSGYTAEAPFDFLAAFPEPDFEWAGQDIDWTTPEMVAHMEEFLSSEGNRNALDLDPVQLHHIG